MKKLCPCMLHGLLLLLPNIADAAGPIEQSFPTIVMSAFAKPGTATPRSLNTLIFTEAFRRLGYRLVVVPLPALRATMMVEAGAIDGELERSAEYGAAHPGLIRIDEAEQVLTLGAYVSNPNLKVSGWSSFLTAPYRFEYRTGIRVAQVSLPAGIPGDRISVIATTEQGLQKLAAGRTDVYIDFDERVRSTLHMQALLRAGQVFRSGTIQEVRINAYLGHKRASLAPALAAVLRAMKQEGVTAAIERTAEIDSDWALVSR